MGLREQLNSKPWIGWVVALIAVATAGVIATRGLWSEGPPDSAERRAEDVTIRCTETGEEWTMNRGQFERLLMTQRGQIDPTKGIPSPYADGRLTGVLVDKDDWESTVERINAAKSMFEGRRRGARNADDSRSSQAGG